MKKKVMDFRILGEIITIFGFLCILFGIGGGATFYPKNPISYPPIFGAIIFLIGISLLCISLFKAKKKRALIMIVILIIISICVLFFVYTWVEGFEYVLPASTSNATTTATIEQSNFILYYAKYETESKIVFAVIRNVGMEDMNITGKNLTAYIDGILSNITFVSTFSNKDYIKYGEVAKLNISNSTPACNKTLYIVTETGLTHSKIISC